MATSPSTSSTSAPFGRGPLFRVATREISMDFSTIGPDQSSHDLGALSETVFRSLLEKFAAIEAVRLLDGDPHLVVTGRRGRFVVFSAQGQLLVRPANDALQPSVKFTPVELSAFLDSADPSAPPLAAPVKNFPSLIGSASLVAESHAADSSVPAAPIYGAFPSRPVTPASAPPPATSAKSAPRRPAGRVVLISLGLAVVVGGAALWFFSGRTPAVPPTPPSPAPVAEFDRIDTPGLVPTLQARVVGTYATSGEGSERLLELRPDGTFHFQEFGSGLATTANRNGTYVFAFRHGTQTPLIRASGLGTIELRDDQSLFCQQAVFKRVP